MNDFDSRKMRRELGEIKNTLRPTFADRVSKWMNLLISLCLVLLGFFTFRINNEFQQFQKSYLKSTKEFQGIQKSIMEATRENELLRLARLSEERLDEIKELKQKLEGESDDSKRIELRNKIDSLFAHIRLTTNFQGMEQKTSPLVYFRLAEWFYKSDEITGTNECFSRAITAAKFLPVQSQVRNLRAIAKFYYDKNDLENSTGDQYYSQAVSLTENSDDSPWLKYRTTPWTLVLWAYQKERSGDSEEAIRLLTRARAYYEKSVSVSDREESKITDIEMCINSLRSGGGWKKIKK